jgi:Arc/MetJ-type ribon-helix-helix transcriptional regulator
MQPLSQPAVGAPLVEIVPRSFRRKARYDHGMTKVSKMTISLPQEQAELVREAVARGEASSVSGYVSAALAAVMAAPADGDDGDILARLVADMSVEDGPPGAEAYAWADRVLGLTEVAD